jgi:predicted nuclease of predicted toxin-antitoxin system
LEKTKLKPPSITKKPPKPIYYLDESVSGTKLHQRLVEAGVPAVLYETLLNRNSVSDGDVFEKATKSNFVVVAKDLAMERDELEALIRTKTRLILLLDSDGGPYIWAAALICSYDACVKIMHDNPLGPLVVRVSKAGMITKIRGEAELKERFLRQQTRKITSAKRHSP